MMIEGVVPKNQKKTIHRPIRPVQHRLEALE